jgi:hypothetical protein
VTDQELRAMVRDAIARMQNPRAELVPRQALGERSLMREPDPEAAFRASVSFAQLPLARGGDGDGDCLIEPTVRCNHCGFCLSYGH